MTREEVKREVTAYITVLETNYSDKLASMKIELAKSKKVNQKE
jgi:hypothetical protein